MRSTTDKLALAVAIVATLATLAQAKPPKPTPAQKCEVAKLGAASRYSTCRIKADSRAILKAVPADYTTCDARLAAAYAKAETRYPGPMGCPTTNDELSMETYLAACTDKARDWTVGTLAKPLVFERFLATGQTTCWDTAGAVVPCAGTGQDGRYTAGAALAYVDNGDGTITDANTGLMWEKLSDDGTIHDYTDFYTWDGAVSVKIAALNTATFAGYTDWRLPNRRELDSLTNLENVNPATSAAFNNGCATNCSVTNCSCTLPWCHWTSSSYANDPTNAWAIDFYDGLVCFDEKIASNSVRAVRGGS